MCLFTVTWSVADLLTLKMGAASIEAGWDYWAPAARPLVVPDCCTDSVTLLRVNSYTQSWYRDCPPGPG